MIPITPRSRNARSGRRPAARVRGLVGAGAATLVLGFAAAQPASASSSLEQPSVGQDRAALVDYFRVAERALNFT